MNADYMAYCRIKMAELNLQTIAFGENVIIYHQRDEKIDNFLDYKKAINVDINSVKIDDNIFKLVAEIKCSHKPLRKAYVDNRISNTTFNTYILPILKECGTEVSFF